MGVHVAFYAMSMSVPIHSFREEHTNEAIHVLVGATLPGGIGVSEEEVRSQRFSDPFVLGQLLTVIGRQRVNASRERRQQRGHCIGDVLRCFRQDVESTNSGTSVC